MTIQSAQQQLLSQLQMLYDEREAANIADWVMEHITGKKKTDRLLNKQQPLLPDLLNKFDNISKDLAAHRPVQYVLGEAWFAGIQFYVNEHTLIPRPETEELVQLVLTHVATDQIAAPTILDIGTGSGCIAIALKKNIPAAIVTAIDVSGEALLVAKENAINQDTAIRFFQTDFLNEVKWTALPTFDIIISNPPYIPINEKEKLDTNVTTFEPHQALFVPENAPLLFYEKIATFGKTHLNPNGKIFMETHEDYTQESADLFSLFYNEVAIKKDIFGKERMVVAEISR